MRTLKVSVAATLCLWFMSVAQAAVSPLTGVVLDSEKVPRPPKWMTEGIAPQGKLSPLESMSKAQLQKEFAACVRLGDVAATKLPEVAPWVFRRQLLCAVESFESGKPLDGTEKIVQRVLKISELENGFPKGSIKTPLAKLLFMRLAREIKGPSREKFWSLYEALTNLDGELSIDERAEVYRLAGEVALAQQQWETALQMFERSQSLKYNLEVSERVSTVRATLKTPAVVAAKPQAPVATPDIEFSADEVKIFNRFSDQIKSGEWLAALDDGLEFLQTYPASGRAQSVSEKIIDSYLALLTKDDDRLDVTRSTYLRRMQKAHPERLVDWAKRILARGFYSEALTLAQANYSSMEKSPKVGSVLETIVHAAWFSGQDSIVRKYAPILLEKSAGTSASAETLLFLGLWEYSQKNYMNAVVHLERLLKGPQGESFELTARYWLWRSHKKLGQAAGDAHADVILVKFPLSYYGLRVRGDLSGELHWDFKPVQIKTKFYLSKAQLRFFKQAQTFIEAGWWEEAQAALRELPMPTDPTARAVWGMYWAAAFNTPKAFQVLNESWDKISELRNPPFVSTVFPSYYGPTISTISKDKRVSANLVRSLIKQESAFFFNAVSSSGALGLMQLMPATAKDVAKTLGKKNLAVPQDLFRPELNIELGTTYIAEMLQQFNNHVPLALAAYNAGPTRLKRWLTRHPSYKDLMQSQSSDPDDDVWIEQLPWSETRGYVKSILRNAWVYELLAHGRVQVTQPLWKPLLAENAPPR